MFTSVKLLRHDRRYMILELKGDTLEREYGVVGTDLPQRTSHTYEAINAGKKNELGPADAAKADYERELKRFLEEGYVEVADFESKVDSIALDLANLPKSFCISKPKTEISEKALDRLIEQGRALFQVKENGLCHLIRVFGGCIDVFTRRIDVVTSKFPALGAHIKQMVEQKHIPDGTILAAELIVPGTDHQLKRFRRMCSISRTDVVKGECKPDQSATHAMIEETPVQAVVFHAPYWGGAAAGPYHEVWGRIKGFDHPLMRAAEILPTFASAKEAFAWVDAHKDTHEGLVVWDLGDCIEISFTGKPKRRAAYKMKPVREADVIAVGYMGGTGKRQGKIGALKLAQLHPDTGEYIDCGQIGSGLTDETSEPTYWNFPVVVQIEYAERFEETGKFQFPRLVGVHPDKAVAECVYDGD